MMENCGNSGNNCLFPIKFKCTFCSLHFGSLGKLINHKESVHQALYNVSYPPSVTPVAGNTTVTSSSSFGPRVSSLIRPEKLTLSSLLSEVVQETTTATTKETCVTAFPLKSTAINQYPDDRDQDGITITKSKLPIEIKPAFAEEKYSKLSHPELSSTNLPESANSDVEIVNSSCRYCGEYFLKNNCSRDASDPSACKSCAKHFGGVAGNSLKIKTEPGMENCGNLWTLRSGQMKLTDENGQQFEKNIGKKPPLVNGPNIDDDDPKRQSLMMKNLMGQISEFGFSCKSCPKSFFSRAGLMAHEKIHSEEDLFPCKFCNKGFTTNKHRIVHERVHTGQRPFPCKICSRSFSQSGNRNTHEKVIHGFDRVNEEADIGATVDVVMNGQGGTQNGPDLMMTEDDCDIPIIVSVTTLTEPVFSRQEGVKTEPPEDPENEENNDHENKNGTKESEEKPLEAEEATGPDHSYAFTSLHRCKICGKWCTSVSKLRQHEVSHSDDRPFACDKCGKSFKRKQPLQLHHMLNRCPGQREGAEETTTYVCNICDRAFTQEDLLKRHHLTHTDGLIYKCDQCEFQGVTFASLKKHKEFHASRSNATVTSGPAVKSFTAATAHSVSSVASRAQDSGAAATSQKAYSAAASNKVYPAASHRVHPTASMKITPPAALQKRQAASTTSQLPGPAPKKHCNETRTSSAPAPPAASAPSKGTAFACKYCRTKFREKIHAAGHMKICFARFDFGSPSPPSFQLNQSSASSVNGPSAGRAVTRVSTDENSPPSRSPSKPSHLLTRRRSETPPPLLERQAPLQVQQQSTVEPSESHIRTITRVPCKYCDNSYESRHIAIHERLHTGERPFSCPTCHKGLISQRSLQRHKCKAAQGLGNEATLPLSIKKEKVDEEVNSEERRFHCSFCNKGFKHNSHRIAHERIHKGERPFACKICSRSFTQCSNRNTHERVIHGFDRRKTAPDDRNNEESRARTSQRTGRGRQRRVIKKQRSTAAAITKKYRKPNLFCRFCSYRTAVATHLEAHETIHTGEKPFACNSCGFRAGNPGRITEHKRRNGCKPGTTKINSPKITMTQSPSKTTSDSPVKAKSSRFVCQICSKSFTQSARLKIHSYTHTGEKPYACGDCDYRTHHHICLHWHKLRTGHSAVTRPTTKSVAPENGKLYCCVYCQKEFGTSLQLRLHLRYHTEARPYSCRGCNAQFKNFPTLLRHKPYCTRSLSPKSSSAPSVKIKTEPDEPESGSSRDAKYIQNLFGNSKQPSKRGRKPIVKPEIDDHIKLDSENRLNPFTCKLCDKTFLVRTNARKHVTRNHLGQNKCDVCGQSFTLLSELVDHFPKHVDKKPYNCPQCPVRFSDLSAREMHIAGHGCDDPFLCLVCGEWFRYDLSFKQHAKTHGSKSRSVL